MECEEWARANAGSAGASAGTGAAGGALVGAALGAGLGAVAGSFFGVADTGAALGAAMGGASGGLQGAAGGAAAQDARLMVAYRNCMAARGYVVDGSVPPLMPAGAVGAVSSPAASRTIESRLRELQSLRSDGLITTIEYRERRQAILEGL